MLTSETLEKFPFLTQLSPESRREIERSGKNTLFREKGYFIHKGERVSGVILVESGCLRAYNIDGQGKETTLYSVMPGESCLLAVNCVFSDIFYPAWVNVDMPDTKVLMIPAELYRQLYSKEDAVRDFTFNVLSARIFDLMTTLEETCSYEVNYRLASFLVRRANSQGEIRLTHQEIASHLGTAREVVSRLLKVFKNKGLLVTSRGTISILSMQGLTSYCHSHH